MPASVFLSYRRGAADGTTGRIYDAVCARLGNEHVFQDIDSIRPGDDFVEVLTRTLASCRVVLVIMGPGWATTTDSRSRRRLDDPHDFVRLEVESAIRSRTPIIPVLIDGAAMPRPEDLPPSLVTLARRHAVEISHTRFKYDVGKLISAVERHLPSERPAGPGPTVDVEELALRAGLTTKQAVSWDIPADARDVWAVLTDLGKYVELVPSCVNVRPHHPGPLALGHSWQHDHLVWGFSNQGISTVIGCEPLRRLTTRNDFLTGVCTLESVTLFQAYGRTVVDCRWYTVVNSFDYQAMTDHTRQYLANLSRLAVALGSSAPAAPRMR